jgi:hypothetical protein
MSISEELATCIGFQWDEGNADKSLERHGVSDGECEQVFFNEPLLVAEDEAHSEGEQRCFALGQTETGRRIFVVFTIRNQLVRVISAREMTAQERRRYEG